MTLSKSRKDAIIPTKTRKTYCEVEDTHWVAYHLMLDLVSQHDTRILIR